MREFLISYKYINKAFRERTGSFSFIYDPHSKFESGLSLSDQILNTMYKNLEGVYDVDREKGMSASITHIWSINENGSVS